MNIYLIFKTVLWTKYYYLHITFEETENKDHISLLFMHNELPQF